MTPEEMPLRVGSSGLGSAFRRATVKEAPAETPEEMPLRVGSSGLGSAFRRARPKAPETVFQKEIPVEAPLEISSDDVGPEPLYAATLELL